MVTLQVVTSTPSRRTLSTSYKHLLTPVGERPPVRRFRLKAESSARSRAMQRLQPSKHAQLLEECGCPMRLSGANSVFLNTTKRPGQVSKLPIDVFNGPSIALLFNGQILQPILQWFFEAPARPSLSWPSSCRPPAACACFCGALPSLISAVAASRVVDSDRIYRNNH